MGEKKRINKEINVPVSFKLFMESLILDDDAFEVFLSNPIKCIKDLNILGSEAIPLKEDCLSIVELVTRIRFFIENGVTTDDFTFQNIFKAAGDPGAAVQNSETHHSRDTDWDSNDSMTESHSNRAYKHSFDDLWSHSDWSEYAFNAPLMNPGDLSSLINVMNTYVETQVKVFNEIKSL